MNGEKVFRDWECRFPSARIITSPSSVHHTHSYRFLTEYFITVHSAIIGLPKKSPAYNFPCESHMLSVSHDTSRLVSIQSAHVMSRVCVYGPSPMRPWNSRSRSVPFSHCCSCFPLVPTQKPCPWRAIDFSRVISVFPLTGRKWNNNRGGRENHRVTLGQTFCLSRMQWPKRNVFNVIPISTLYRGRNRVLPCPQNTKLLAALLSRGKSKVRASFEHLCSLGAVAYFSDLSKCEGTMLKSKCAFF